MLLACVGGKRSGQRFMTGWAALLLTACWAVAPPNPAWADDSSGAEQNEPSDSGQPHARKARLVGVVIATDSRPGDKISGSILVNPNAYNDIPGLRVVKTHIDLPVSQRRKVLLAGVVVDAAGTSSWADGNFVAQLPSQPGPLAVTLRRDQRQLAVVQVPVDSTGSPAISCGSGWVNGMEGSTATDYRSPASYCFGGVEVITGAFSGDARSTRVEIGGQAGHIIAETPREVYWVLPPGLTPGPNQVTLHEGSQVITFRVRVPRLDVVERVETADHEIDPNQPAPSVSQASPSSSGGLFGLPIGIGVGFGESSGEERREVGVAPEPGPEW